MTIGMLFRRWDKALVILLAGALLARLGVVWATSSLDVRVVDEQQYVALARNLVDGNGFSRDGQRLTSSRPPLYPAAVAAIWRLTGSESLVAVRVAQALIGVFTVGVIFRIGNRLCNRRVAILAAAFVAFYPSLVFYSVLILSETLFTFLLALMVLGCMSLIGRPSVWVALGTGLSLGAAALTRSIMWPFVFVLLAGIAAGLVVERQWRWRTALLVFAGYALLVAPWSYRNTALQGTFTVVDTMGGRNLMMGNYAHTPEDRMWDAISLTGDRAWDSTLPWRAPHGGWWSEGDVDRWAQQQAIAYMRAHPWITARRTLLKFADFWGLEREFLAGVWRGLYQVPTGPAIVAGAAMVGAYAAVVVLAVTGLVLAPPFADRRAHVLLVALLLFVSGIHAIVFGHPRYHIPLVPVLALYAGAAIDARPWRRRWSGWEGWIAPSLVACLMLFWVRDIFLRDLGRLSELAARFGFKV